MIQFHRLGTVYWFSDSLVPPVCAVCKPSVFMGLETYGAPDPSSSIPFHGKEFPSVTTGACNHL